MLTEMDSALVRLDPALIMVQLGYEPDPWQSRLLRSRSPRVLLNCHRQSGKSTVVSALAINTALHEPDSLVLLVSASLRQSSELFRKVVTFYRALGSPVPAVEDNAQTLGLSNRSRVISLPDSPDTVVGFSAPALVVCDEAARISDEMLVALAPMLVTNAGRLVMMTTPKGKRGVFYEAWTSPDATWDRVEFKASMNPRIPPEFLAEQLAILGPRWFRQEFECSFEETIDAVFTTESINNAFDSAEPPIFEGLI